MSIARGVVDDVVDVGQAAVSVSTAVPRRVASEVGEFAGDVAQNVRGIADLGVDIPGTSIRRGPTSFMEDLERPAATLIGGLSGGTDGAARGFTDTGWGTAQGRNVPGIRDLPDDDVIGSFSPRDIGGGIASVALDPLNLIGGAPQKAGQLAVKGAKATRGLPVGLGIEDISKGAEEAVQRPPSFQALRDALAGEVKLRRSGVPATEIAEGRSLQAGRISGMLEGVGPNASLDDRLRAAASGAKVGGLRKTFGQPLELTGVDKDELAAHLQDALAGDGPFAQFNGLRALDNLIKGESVQPAQLKLLRRVFGDDIGKLVRDAAAGRPSPIAALGDEAGGAISRAERFGEKQIAQLEQRALAQFKHATDLAADLTMDPTNARLQKTVEQAREKGLIAQNRADHLLVQRAQKLAGVPEEPAEALAQQKATYGALNSMRAAEEAQRAGGALNREQAVLLQAKDLLGRKFTVSPTMQDAQLESVDYWLKGNRGILDAIGETTHEKMRSIAATMSGNLADSFLTNLYQRKTLIEAALEKQGMTPELARKAGQHLVDAELEARYPQGIPERLAAEIAKTKLPEIGTLGGDLARGAAALSQEWKNLAFGPADVGVFGQQVLHAAQASPTNIMAGVVNRALNVLHMGLDTTLIDETALAKRIQYQLDGVPQGITTGIVQDAKGSPILGRLGTEKYNLGRLVDASSDFQFGTILGGLRNLNYEGNLVALHLTGQDITNPGVRSTAAGFANSATSYAPAALNAARALGEKAVLMTPSMRRAQVASILQLGRVFTPKATPSERILGAIAIANIAGSVLGVGKLLNDRIGVGDFEFDPSKKGFGQIVTKMVDSQGRHIILPLFPQLQVATTIAKSLREIAQHDPEAAAREWAKLVMGSSSPALQLVEKASGYGYQPGEGYKYGDLQGGVLNVAPLAPVLQSLLQGEISPQTTPLEAGGFSAYPESASPAVKRGEFRSLKGEAQLAALPSETWRRMGASKEYGEKLKDYPNVTAWREAKTEEFTERLKTERGMTETQAKAEAERAVQRHAIYKQYIETKGWLETKWVEQNPEAAQKLWDETMRKPSFERGPDDWMPTKAQQEIIRKAGAR